MLRAWEVLITLINFEKGIKLDDVPRNGGFLIDLAIASTFTLWKAKFTSQRELEKQETRDYWVTGLTTLSPLAKNMISPRNQREGYRIIHSRNFHELKKAPLKQRQLSSEESSVEIRVRFCFACYYQERLFLSSCL
ncbi:hypothetical protein TNCV_3928311 [Trichonephila clavipes]|nr:hypothetical protein TNCV_3928311 [Trichonephila clavipes]